MVGAFHVWRERDDERGCDVVDAFEFGEVGWAYEFGVLGAGVFLINKGAFDVEAWGAAEFLVGHVLGAFGGDFLEFFLGLGEGGGEPGGDAFLEFAFGDVADGLVGVVADVVLVGAVAVDVEEAGHDELVFGVDGLVGLWEGGSGGEDLGDFAVFDEDGAVLDFDVGGDDVGVGDERFHRSGERVGKMGGSCQ